MITLKKTNNHKIIPIKTKVYDPSRIQGYDLIPELYCTIFICAHKKSGKTNVINKILRECVGKKTKIFIVASTIVNDPNWVAIVEYFEKKGNEIKTATSFDDKNNFQDIIQELRNEADEKLKMKKEKNKPDSREDPNCISIPCDYGWPEDEDKKDNSDSDSDSDTNKKSKKRKTKKKPKKKAPKWIFVFDDMSKELRRLQISELIKNHRHFKCKIILSSQYCKDLNVDTRENIDFWILFADHSLDKLETIYENGEFKIPFELFVKLYKNATKEKWGFLFINRIDNIYKKNFTHQYLIPKQLITGDESEDIFVYGKDNG